MSYHSWKSIITYSAFHYAGFIDVNKVVSCDERVRWNSLCTDEAGKIAGAFQ